MRTAVAATAICFSIVGLSTAAEVAAAIRRPTDIPAQALRPALQMLSKERDFQVVFRTDLVGEVRTSGAVGECTVTEALTQLLSGTGLTYSYLDDQTVTIVPLSVTSSGGERAPQADEGTPLSLQGTPSTGEEKKGFWSRFRLAQAEPASKSDTQPSAEKQTTDNSSESPQKRIEFEEIVVTGTHIRGAPPSSPVVTLTQEEMRLSGHTNLGEAVRSLPQNFSGGQNPEVGFGATGGGSANQNGSGGSGLNLRGLGPGATLTLLNGSRLPYDGIFQATDISVIPVAAIERVEILLDGASAVYGSDAVGGVANVVLKRDYEGAEISARYGAATEGGYGQQQYTAVFGDTWASGGFLLTGDFSRRSSIRARHRDYLEYMPNQGVSIYPASEQTSILLSGHQDITDTIELAADVIYSERDQQQDLETTNILLDNRAVETWGFSPSLRVDLPGDWSTHIRGFIGENNIESEQLFLAIADRSFLRRAEGVTENSAKMFSVEGEGPIFQLPGGEVRLAVGAGYRRNDLIFDDRFIDLTDVKEGRASKFAYGEATLPLVAEAQSIPLVSSLLLNGAVRYEDYDDFGSVTTPKVGLTWTVAPDFDLKMSWGKSFKAPTLVDQYLPTFVTLFPSSVFGDPNAPAGSTVIILNGGNPDLGPERAETAALGFKLTPRGLPGLQIELNWFQIDYDDRIVSPLGEAFFTATTDPIYAEFVAFNPTLAQQQSAFALGRLPFGQFSVDLTGGAYDPNAVYAIENGVNANASSQEATGFDLSLRYDVAIADGNFSLTGNANWLQGTRKLTALSPEQDTTGRIFFPAEFKARAGAVWSRDGFSLSSHVNYIDGIANIYFPSNPQTNAWTTVDMVVDYQANFPALGSVGLNLAIINLMDERPPSLQPRAAYLVDYDVTNYSATGRLISATLTKRF